MPLTTEDERTGASVTGAATTTQARPGPAGGGVLRNREFRGVIMAQATSECGDQIAAIAISLLVYGRSNSPFLAAATYAVTYVPWVFGSVLLSPLADRFPRRNVMLTCDAGRAIVISLLALASMVHGMPIPALIGLVLVSSFFSPPFSSARGATLPDIFESGKRYVRAVAISRILQQVDQVFGFALGGLVVAAVTPRGALALDALTFVASYGLIHTHLSLRPAADARGRPSLRSLVRGALPDLAIVWRHPARRALLMFSAFSLIFLIAPDSLAVAYARQHGQGAVVAGLLAASQPLGVALGAWAFIKFVPVHVQGRFLLPLGVVGAACLVLTCTVPPIGLLCVLWIGSGLAQAFLVATIAAYNVVTDRAVRGRANGLAAATIAITQGVGFLLWGAVAEWRGAAAGVAWAGITGLLVMAIARYLWPHDVIDGAWAKLASAQEEH
jgi:MFS family permease